MVQLRVLFIGVNILVLIIVLWFHKMLTLEETGGGEIYNNSLWNFGNFFGTLKLFQKIKLTPPPN